MEKEIIQILAENKRRNETIAAKFNPITGEGSILERKCVEIADFPIKKMWLPVDMLSNEMVSQLIRCGSIKKYLEKYDGKSESEGVDQVVELFTRIRILYDFPFWAALFVHIKPKGGGDDVLFRLNRAQRRLIEKLESMRRRGKPIRLILLKARQWGGSTATQMYMAWLQLVHRVGLNSLIVGHVKDASTEVKDMFDRMLTEYPVKLLHKIDEEYDANETKIVAVGKTGNIQRIPQRKCKLKIGTAEKPNSARGGDYNLVHLTEVGLWKITDGKKPEDIVRSACSGVLLEPYTMIVYESTANGTGNLFHREYLAAKTGKSQFEHLFIPWFDIEQYALPFSSDKEKQDFAEWLYNNRNNDFVSSDREEPGNYLWKLWMLGATLEAIHWYISERSKYGAHADMAAEYPSTDIEAFAFSGRKVFSDDDIEQFRSACRPPRRVGEIYGHNETGEDALVGLTFKPEVNGRLAIWEDVEQSEDEAVTDQYLVVVDVCKGLSEKADFAVIVVFNRLFMIEGERPSVAAQWYGHIDMDLLAWKATQIAEYYNHALLVIESNTLETNNTKGDAEYILNLIREVYDNLYARKQSAEDILNKVPQKYGFHTNTLTKKVIILNLKSILREHLYTERDEGCLDEYATYIETPNGGYEATEGHHDDKLMTRAIGLYVCFHEMEIPQIITKTQTYHKPQKAISAATI